MNKTELKNKMGIPDGEDVIAFITDAEPDWLNRMAAEVIIGWEDKYGNDSIFYVKDDYPIMRKTLWVPCDDLNQCSELMKKSATADCYPRFWYDYGLEKWIADASEIEYSDIEYDGDMLDLQFESDDYSCLVRACLAATWLNAPDGEAE